MEASKTKDIEMKDAQEPSSTKEKDSVNDDTETPKEADLITLEGNHNILTKQR